MTTSLGLTAPLVTALLVTALLVTTMATTGRAAAQTGTDGAGTTDATDPTDGELRASLEVVGQSTFIAADGALGLDLAVAPADRLWRDADRYLLSVTIYGRLESEAEVDEPLNQPLNRLPPIPLDSLPRGGGGPTNVVHLDIPVRSGTQFDDLERVLLPQPGVYPISIELRTEAGPIASTRTHMVRLPQVTNEDDQPSNGPGGPPGSETAAPDSDGPNGPIPVAMVLNVATAEGLTLPDVQQILIDHPAMPLTVVLQEGVTNLLRADPELARSFVAAVGGRPVLAVPPTDLDPSALAEIGQSSLYFESHLANIAGLRALGLTVPEEIGLIGAPLTAEGAEAVAELNVRSVLDPESRAVGVGRLAGRPGLHMIRFDRELSRNLGGGDDGPHRANRILAKLTLRGQEDDAPVVLGGEALGVDPGRSIDAFLRALSQPGAPRPILVSEATGGPSIRIAERPEQDLRPVAELLLEVQAALKTYEGFHSGGGNTPAFYRRQILASLTRQRNPSDRHRALSSLLAQIHNDMTVVELHQGQPVTLAAREAPIPILLDSNAVGPRNVMLRFDSDKVVADHDRRIVTLEPGTSSLNVELQARSLGVSPLEVSVWTPDGQTRLTATRFEIRSTAIPGFGLLVSIGAVVLLGAWWVVDAKKRRENPVT